MKLYVKDQNNRKVFLNLSAPTKRDLAHLIGSENFYLKNRLYNISDVRAESDNSTTTGSIIGGVVGALAGPIGILIGGLIGGLIGNSADNDKKAEVNRFNNS